MAAAVMRSLVADAGWDDRVVVESAGTGDWHLGRSADDRALRVLRAHGYDGTEHRARRFDAAWFDHFDLVLAMDSENYRVLRRVVPADQADKVVMLRSFDPTASPDDLDVPDPYYDDEAGFEEVLEMVERGAVGLLAQLREQA
jgi:protein-tyrosine phosphatase